MATIVRRKSIQPPREKRRLPNSPEQREAIVKGLAAKSNGKASGHTNGKPHLEEIIARGTSELYDQCVELFDRDCYSPDEGELLKTVARDIDRLNYDAAFRSAIVALLKKYGLLTTAVSQETPAAEAGESIDYPMTLDADEPVGDVEISDDIFVVPIGELVRHPQNRHPKKSRVDELAKSLAANGQRDPVKVRRVGIKWQILSGETRMLAARQVGLKTLKARKVVCDDAQAFKILGEENSERTDLDDIEKAEYLAIAVAPPLAGGYGLRWEEAAKRVGLESDSAAKNLVRLLELPQEWRERVAAGELPQTFARELLRVARWPRLMAHVDAEWKRAACGLSKEEAGKRGKWDERKAIERFESRLELESFIDRVIDNETRPVDGKTTHHYDWEVVKEWGIREPRLFELTDELRTELEIGTFRIDKKEVELATNAKAFDRLNLPLVKKKIAARQKKQARGQASRDERRTPAPKREPTAAELKARQAEQAKQLAARVRGWRHRFLCLVCAERITASATWPGLKFAVWMLGELRSEIRSGWTKATGGRTSTDYSHGNYGVAWSSMHLAAAAKPGDEATCRAMDAVLCEIGAAYLGREDNDPRHPRIAFAVVDGLAADLGIDLAAEWRHAQAKDSPRRSHFEAFFELFQSGQLEELGRDLNVFADNAKTRDAKVKRFTGALRTLPLPKCLGKVAGKSKSKGKK